MTEQITNTASARTTLRIKTNVRAGAVINHGLRVKTKLRAGGLNGAFNHGLRIRAR
jgi:hypothetical protein